MTANSYQELSHTLLKKGEMRLLQGDLTGLHYFDQAMKLDPSNASLLYAQGLSLLEYGNEENGTRELRLACKRFQMAVKLNPNYFEALSAWGNTLFLLGIEENDTQLLYQARDQYKAAIALSKGKGADILADLHWDYGNVWAKISETSGEAIDLNIALKSFEKTISYQEDLPADFWQNFGTVALQLGEHTNDLRLFMKAIDCYKNAISISISSHEGWFYLGEALSALYFHTHDEDHFNQANECYATAVQFNPHKSSLWHSWALLLGNAGRELGDPKRLRACIEKCQHAHDPSVNGIWAEALALLGVKTDKLQMIHDAQNKIGSSKAHPHAEGMCLYALGQYFGDLDTYYQAVKKFQSGLEGKRSDHRLWHSLGVTTMTIAETEGTLASYEKAAQFFSKALNLQMSSVYHYNYASALTKCGELSHDEETLRLAVHHFEQAFSLQKKAVYLHPNWMFEYACALDLLGNFSDDDKPYTKALEILNHVLTVDPEYPQIHYQLALVLGHYGQLTSQSDLFHRSIHHYQLAHQKETENDQIILDWALTLINLGQTEDSLTHFKEAEYKMIQAARLGNTHSYYHLACLYSLQADLEKAAHFLEKAHSFQALPPSQELLEDEWLENLRQTDFFSTFLTRLGS